MGGGIWGICKGNSVFLYILAKHIKKFNFSLYLPKLSFMEDLAKMVSIIFASSMVIGGVAGNRIAKHYGKSQTIGTLIGIGVGFVGLVAVVRIKGKLDMQKMEQQQQQVEPSTT